jgi:hypothetical protein
VIKQYFCPQIDLQQKSPVIATKITNDYNKKIYVFPANKKSIKQQIFAMVLFTTKITNYYIKTYKPLVQK